MVLEVIYVVRHGVGSIFLNYLFQVKDALAARLTLLDQHQVLNDDEPFNHVTCGFDTHVLTSNIVPFKLGGQSRNRRVHWHRPKSNRNSIRPSPRRLWRKASRRIGKSYLDTTTSSRRRVFQSILQMPPDYQASGGQAADSPGVQENQG